MLKQRESGGSGDENRKGPNLDPESLWICNVGELIEQLASTDPTPGGGSCAVVVASMGAALLQKAVAVSLKKEPAGTPKHEELERLLAQLGERASVLHKSADRDAAAYESYLRAVRLPHGDPREAELRQKAMEAATIDATLIPLSATGEIRQIVASGLPHLPLVHKVVASDAVIALRLLLTSATCLLTTAEDNLLGLTRSPAFGSFDAQRRDLARLLAESERELERYGVDN